MILTTTLAKGDAEVFQKAANERAGHGGRKGGPRAGKEKKTEGKNGKCHRIATVPRATRGSYTLAAEAKSAAAAGTEPVPVCHQSRPCRAPVPSLPTRLQKLESPPRKSETRDARAHAHTHTYSDAESEPEPERNRSPDDRRRQPPHAHTHRVDRSRPRGVRGALRARVGERRRLRDDGDGRGARLEARERRRRDRERRREGAGVGARGRRGYRHAQDGR